MNVKTIFVTVLTMVLLILGGCQDAPETYALMLMNEDGSVYEERLDLDREEVELPILEKDGLIFVGWDDGEMNHYDSYIVKEDKVLTAKFEDAEDVFLLTKRAELNTVSINDYIGEAIYLRIPKEIDGFLIKKISRNAFTGSSIEVVEIPITVSKIDESAFEDADHLREVSYYGLPEGERETNYTGEELEEKLDEYGDLCEIASMSIDAIDVVYEEGCPIISSSKHDSVWIDDIEYSSYRVVLDLAYMPEEMLTYISTKAFKNADALETIHLPAGIAFINGAMVEGAMNLKEITVHPSSSRYQSVDGVLYNKSMTAIIIYPNAKSESTYVVPEEILSVSPYAFIENNRIETVVIHENFDDENILGFAGMNALKEFIVDENHPTLITIDGVLFSRDDILLIYPNGKVETTYQMPEDIVRIGDNSFMNNETLSEIIFSNELEEIGKLAFYNTTSLKMIDIPESIRLIEYGVWANSNIEIIIIRRSTSDGFVPQILSPIIASVRGEKEVTYYVPDDSVSDYSQLLNNYVFDNQVQPLSEYEEENE